MDEFVVEVTASKVKQPLLKYVTSTYISLQAAAVVMTTFTVLSVELNKRTVH